jgi:hypothetical protein
MLSAEEDEINDRTTFSLPSALTEVLTPPYFVQQI